MQHRIAVERKFIVRIAVNSYLPAGVVMKMLLTAGQENAELNQDWIGRSRRRKAPIGTTRREA